MQSRIRVSRRGSVVVLVVVVVVGVVVVVIVVLAVVAVIKNSPLDKIIKGRNK